MKPDQTFSKEEKLALAAMGEIPVGELDAAETIQEMEQVVATLRALYEPPASTEIEIPSEFQIERMERAREVAAEALNQKARQQRPVWSRLALVAAVLVLGVLPFLIKQQESGITSPTLAQHNDPADPYVGVRGGSGKSDPGANATAEATALAPLGEIRTRSPLSFLWKADPRVSWELRLFRQGETEPLAKVTEAKSPLPIERLLPESGQMESGGSFRWELVNPASGEITALGNFQLSSDAGTYATTDSEKLQAAMAAATAEGRPSEALILLFSLHNDLPSETFIRLRRELEEKILQK